MWSDVSVCCICVFLCACVIDSSIQWDLGPALFSEQCNCYPLLKYTPLRMIIIANGTPRPHPPLLNTHWTSFYLVTPPPGQVHPLPPGTGIYITTTSPGTYFQIPKRHISKHPTWTPFIVDHRGCTISI